MHPAKTIVGAAISMLVLAGGALAQSTEPLDTDQELDRLDALKKGLIDTTSGFYLSPVVSVGYVDGDIEVNEGGIVIDDEFDGLLFRLGGALGYQTGILRSEFEVTAGRAETELDLLDEESTLDYVKWSALSYFDAPYDLSTLITDGLPETIPYVGFGIGGFYYDIEDGGSDVSFVAEVLAGLGVRLSPRWFVDAGYRWTYIPILEDDGSESEVSFNSIEAKLRYRF